MLIITLGPFRSQHHHDRRATPHREACLATALDFRGRGITTQTLYLLGPRRGGEGEESLADADPYTPPYDPRRPLCWPEPALQRISTESNIDSSKSRAHVLHYGARWAALAREDFCFSGMTRQGMSWNKLRAGSVAALQLVKASSVRSGRQTNAWLAGYSTLHGPCGCSR